MENQDIVSSDSDSDSDWDLLVVREILRDPDQSPLDSTASVIRGVIPSRVDNASPYLTVDGDSSRKPLTGGSTSSGISAKPSLTSHRVLPSSQGNNTNASLIDNNKTSRKLPSRATAHNGNSLNTSHHRMAGHHRPSGTTGNSGLLNLKINQDTDPSDGDSDSDSDWDFDEVRAMYAQIPLDSTASIIDRKIPSRVDNASPYLAVDEELSREPPPGASTSSGILAKPSTTSYRVLPSSRGNSTNASLIDNNKPSRKLPSQAAAHFGNLLNPSHHRMAVHHRPSGTTGNSGLLNLKINQDTDPTSSARKDNVQYTSQQGSKRAFPNSIQPQVPNLKSINLVDNQPSSPFVDNPLSTNNEVESEFGMERPTGRKAAKKMKRAGTTDGESLELLKSMQKDALAIASQTIESVNMSLQLQKEMMQIQKAGQERHNEIMQLQKEKLQLRLAKEERERQVYEASVMAMDTSKMAPDQAKYYDALKARILRNIA